MSPSVGNVARLAKIFGKSVARVSPNDTSTTLSRVVARRATPLAVANAPCDASISQAPARPLLREVSAVMSSEHDRATSSPSSKSTIESTALPYQTKFAKNRAFFEQLASASKAQLPRRLDRADIPKRLDAGGTVVWEPIATSRVLDVSGDLSRDVALDRTQTRKPVNPEKSPERVALRLGNIVQNRKACLRTREASVVRASEDITVPTKFSMRCLVSPQSPTASSGSDSDCDSSDDNILRGTGHSTDKSTVDMPAIPQPGGQLAAQQFRFDSLGAGPSKRTLSRTSSEDSPDSSQLADVSDLEMPASVNKQDELERYFLNLVPPASSKEDAYVEGELVSEEALSDYESDFSESSSDFSGSSPPSSPSGSPDPREPKSSWSLAYAEELHQPPFSPPDENVTWAEIKDTIGQLNAAIADENECVASVEAIGFLQLAGSHAANRNIQAAHDALIRALSGVTKVQAVQDETEIRSPSPSLSEPPSDPWEEALSDEECTAELDDWLRSLKHMAMDCANSARGKAAKALRAEAMEMFQRNLERTVHTFLKPAIQDLRHLPSTRRPEFAEGFWT